MESRERLGSRLGFILLSAGCAIGCGNVWEFPWMAGQFGGGAFVLIYLFFLVVLGLPVMTIEFAMGRASQKSPVGIYQVLEPKGSKWHIHGYFALAGNVILMMFYTVVAGWMLNYAVKTMTGAFVGLDAAGVGGEFGKMLSSPAQLIIYMAIIVALGFLVLSFSLKGGLERVTKYMMLALFVIMVVLAIHSCTMEGSKPGLSFYLLPDFSKITWDVVVGAMNQAFFTLSLGIGSMAIFGSYIGKDRSLMGESINIIVLDTLVALIAGLIIFPACFTYGVQPDNGPSLIFVTLPNIFNNMALGRLWGTLFFLFMTFAAFSTVLAVFENILACIRELTGWGRKKASLICGVAMFLLSLPCALGFNVLSGIEPLGKGTGIMDLEDFAVSNVLLPLGSMIFVLFATMKKAWGWDKFVSEANAGKGAKVKPWMRFYISYVLPLIIIAIFVIGIVSFFKKPQ